MSEVEDGSELVVELTNESARTEVHIETRTGRVVIMDAAERDLEVYIEGMLYSGVVVGEVFDLDDDPKDVD